jgi:hypothetical protein
LAFARFEGVSVFDGMYWANTTINTVGYGDISRRRRGKVLSMVLQWTGNVILAMLIGGVAAFAQQLLLGEDVEELGKEVDELEEDVEDGRGGRGEPAGERQGALGNRSPVLPELSG